ncbi:YtxH domain-containing protein [Formosa sp. S-31]|uniref:YtxH domain-containing protein n=1 Tax=Formosa sp. S-31 TaxID=2790949 RepID=UPI003EBBD908
MRNTFLGVVAGTALGAAMGILLAPEKGSKTRKTILKEAESTKNKFADQASDIIDAIAKKMNVKKGTLEDQIESIVTDTSHKSDDLIEALEKKLEVLKTKNRHFRTNGKTTATV